MMHAPIFKASDPHNQAFKAYLEYESVPMKRAFERYVGTLLKSTTDAQINAWIDNKDIQGFLKYAADHIDEMSDQLPKTFVKAAQREIDRLSQPGTFGIGKLDVKFEPGNPVAVDLAEDGRLKFIKDFTAKQRDAVQGAIDDAIKTGKGPIYAARQFRDSIGLTRGQAEAVQNYQRLLENNNSAALERKLRDARFDRTIARTFEDDEPLTGKQIERMVERYTEKMRNYRAENIARTETMRAVNSAKQAAWKQLADKLDIDYEDVEKTWIATIDGRERDTHHDMNRQTVKGLDTPFVSPSGAELMYPGDLSAPADEVILCRCTAIVRFPPPGRMIGKGFDPDEPRDEHGRWTGVGYHGTASAFDEFESREPVSTFTGNKDTKGVYFSGDERQAWGYANLAAKRPGAGKKRVIAADLHMDNPLDITNAIKRGQKKGLSFGDAKRAAMKDLTPEHDGVVFRGNSVNHPEYVVFHRSQIHRIGKT